MKELELPPTYCSNMCRNVLGEKCVEECNPNRDMSAFELKKGVELPDLPPFPLDEFVHTMTPEERKVIMAVYMAKTVDFVQGRKAENVNPPRFLNRPLPYSARHSEDPDGFPFSSVQPDTRDELCEDRKEHPSKKI